MARVELGVVLEILELCIVVYITLIVGATKPCILQSSSCPSTAKPLKILPNTPGIVGHPDEDIFTRMVKFDQECHT